MFKESFICIKDLRDHKSTTKIQNASKKIDSEHKCSFYSLVVPALTFTQ